MMDLPEDLLDVATVAEIARRRHTLEDVLVAAGMPRPRRVDREAIVARWVVREGILHAEDIQYWRDFINKLLDLEAEMRHAHSRQTPTTCRAPQHTQLGAPSDPLSRLRATATL